jgi:hypothetical protein
LTSLQQSGASQRPHGTNFTSEDWNCRRLARPAVAEDLRTLTARFAETYFRIVAEAIHRHDPHHLNLGSRFQARTPEAVMACAKCCDVVSFNVYREDFSGEEWGRFHALGKLALIGEFQFGSTDTGLFWPGLFDVAAEEERGPAYAGYLARRGRTRISSAFIGFNMSTSRSTASRRRERTYGFRLGRRCPLCRVGVRVARRQSRFAEIAAVKSQRPLALIQWPAMTADRRLQPPCRRR